MMNSSSVHAPLRPNSLQNLNPGKFWTNTSISGWVDSIYSQSEVYIKHERELKDEELKLLSATGGTGGINEPIDLDGMDIATPNNSNNNNSGSNNNNNSNNNSQNINSMNMNNMNNMNNININTTTTTTTSNNTK